MPCPTPTPTPTLTPLGDRLLLELRRAVRRRRLAVTVASAAGPGRQLVFTAPHTLELVRDGHPFHLMESYTGTLADRFASAVRGAGCVTWTEAERKRVRAVTKARGEPDVGTLACGRTPNPVVTAPARPDLGPHRAPRAIIPVTSRARLRTLHTFGAPRCDPVIPRSLIHCASPARAA